MSIYWNKTIIWLEGTGHDAHNSPNTPTSTTVGARVTWGERRVLDQNGELTLAAAIVRMKGKPDPGQDKLTIDGVTHMIINVREHLVFKRVAYYEVAVR